MSSRFSFYQVPRYAVGISMGLMPLLSHAAASHAFENSLANAISWVAVTAMPVVALYLFWKIHVLPEVIAEKRHHPQAEAIKVLCLLSLVFGGLLWPIAWLWAYMRPIQIPVVRGRRKRDPWHASLYGDEESASHHGHHHTQAHAASSDGDATIDRNGDAQSGGSEQANASVGGSGRSLGPRDAVREGIRKGEGA